MTGSEPDGPDAAPARPPRHRSGILHGRQQGRRLRDGQRSVLQRLLPLHAIDLTGPIEVGTLFSGELQALRLEIGFGGGEHLMEQAALHPDVGFIGCEPFRNGVASLLQQVDGRGGPNIRLHAGDAGEVIDRLPAGALSHVDILYPDPWPKRRQRKRRLLSDAMLARLARVMRPGAVLRFATDIDDYAGWTLARILVSPDFRWDAASADDWRHPWPGWVQTRYEAKAAREGRTPVYLTFVRR